MSNQHYLHFTLGPVQGFVSQARRTRDFWAGSFLLSWLTAKAMAAVQGAGGKIVMPEVDGDDLLKAVKGEPLGKDESGNDKELPKIGSLPNNFIAEVPVDFDGKVAVDAVQDAWKALADAVWQKDKLDAAGVSRDLWDNQIKSFWDMAWVVAGSDDGKVLAMRKNWRTYMPPESQGDKCTMMGEWQELSGADKPNPEQQKKLWEKLKPFGTMDLRENERLCAIAYVKRRFVHVWQALDGHKGWELPTAVPSTHYMAAVHWLEQAVEYGDNSQLQAFHDAAKGARKGYGEWGTDIKCIKEKVGKKDLAFWFTSLDGQVFFKSALENSNEFEPEKAEPVLSALHELTQIKVSNGQKLGHPSPFYAILMMDGDNLGKTKEAMGDATDLSAALARFTSEVPEVVQNHNGFLIYAGGDDVLAMLPLEDALPCAAEVREKYMRIFEGKGLEDGNYSISAAIEYAHMKLPLTMILKDAHKLLDDVAKDATGRDAVACRVWKPGGQQLTWSMPWEQALKKADGEKDENKREVIIAQLANKLGEDEQGDAGYASKLLYHIRETLDMLQGGSQIKNQVIQDMLVADYIGSGLLDGVSDKKAKAEELIKPLLKQCRVFKNKVPTGQYRANGALLLRFLAQKGVER